MFTLIRNLIAKGLSTKKTYICLLKLTSIAKIKMKKAGNILIIDDNRGVRNALQLLLKPHFDRIEALSSPATLPTYLNTADWQVILLDMNFKAGINNGNEGLYWLHEIKKMKPYIPVVLFTAYADISLAVRGIKEGATDFVVKPWDNDKLIETLLAAAIPSERLQVKQERMPMYWGESAAMNRLRHLVEKIADTDANVLITGENGTGKEMLAREIHRLSSRRHHEMITVDMGALTETLFESELFGHVKGAFTDARNERTGKFEAANDSSLFLDEIGNLPFHLQAKLLTAIQQKAVVKVGSNLPIPVNIRLICATNRNLPDMVKRGEFREDLLYRINTIHLEIPPLRQRTEDILPLAEQFICRFCQQYHKKSLKLPDDSCEKLLKHPWYGNIRELEHTIEKAVIICDGTTLTTDCFQLAHSPARTTTMELPQVSTLEAMERQMIAKALQNCEGNLSAVAASLGISRQTLYNKMKRYGL